MATSVSLLGVDWMEMKATECSPGVLAVGGDVSSSTTLGAEGGVGDTPWFCVLPRAKNPAQDSTMHVDWGWG